MSAGNNLPTDTEVLFFALQIVQRAETAAEAKVWAQEVLRFSGGSTEADVWPPPGAAEWKGKSSKPAPLYARMDAQSCDVLPALCALFMSEAFLTSRARS